MTTIEVVIMNHLTRIINAILMYICHLLNADKSVGDQTPSLHGSIFVLKPGLYEIDEV